MHSPGGNGPARVEFESGSELRLLAGHFHPQGGSSGESPHPGPGISIRGVYGLSRVYHKISGTGFHHWKDMGYYV